MSEVAGARPARVLRSTKLEMNFLPDVWVTCDVCKGKRYTRETLEVEWKGKRRYDVLQMTVQEACTFFENQRGIHRIVSTLNDVGLGYTTGPAGDHPLRWGGTEGETSNRASQTCKKAHHICPR